MAIYKKSASVVRFTPEMAKMYLELRYEHQRNVEKRTVSILAMAMRNGTFTDSKIDVGVLNECDRKLLNGQHTMHAIIESGTTHDLTVTEHYAQYESDLAHLYETFDLQRRRRYADSMRVHRLSEILSMPEKSIESLGAALAWARSNFGVDKQFRNFVTFTDRREWSVLWKWEMHAILEAIAPCDKQTRTVIAKQSVLSVALVTMRYQPEKAFAFWRQVAWQDGLKQYDPRQTLRRYLASTSRTYQYEKEKIAPHEISRAVALAWNAYMEERLLRYVLVREPDKVLRIAGTPYTGNQSPNYLSLSESPNRNRSLASLHGSSVANQGSSLASNEVLLV